MTNYYSYDILTVLIQIIQLDKGGLIVFQINIGSNKPIYEQIIEQTKLMISSKGILPGDKMPSVRTLSMQLSVNPNTIQRAYSDMCKSGILYSIAGKGCFVDSNAKDMILKTAEKDISEFTDCVDKMRISGVAKSKLINEIERVYGGN